MDTKMYVTIGEAAKESGVSPKMIRYYESVGLILKAVRSNAGYRYYTQNDIQAICFIRHAREFGFALNDIARLIRLWQQQDGPSAEVKEIVVKHVDALRQRIAELETTCQTLERLAELCRGDAGHECPILHELGEPSHAARFPSVHRRLPQHAAGCAVGSDLDLR